MLWEESDEGLLETPPPVEDIGEPAPLWVSFTVNILGATSWPQQRCLRCGHSHEGTMPKLNQDPNTCGRQACEHTVSGAIIRIWNEPAHVDGFKDYCVSCGMRIIQFNQAQPDDIKLRWAYTPGDTTLDEKEPEDLLVMPELPGGLHQLQKWEDVFPNPINEDHSYSDIARDGRWE